MNLNDTIAVLFGGRSSEHEISLRSAVFVLKNIPEKYNIIPVGISRNSTFHSLTGSFTSKHFQQITTQDLATIIDGRVPSQFNESKNLFSAFLPIRNEALPAQLLNNSPIRILNCEASCIFPVLHGPNGEDGRLQGVFELAEIAYVGCDIRSSVVGMDKDIQKRLAREAGIPIAKYEVVDIEEYAHKEENVIKKIESKIAYPCFVKPNSLGSGIGTSKVTNTNNLIKALHDAFAFDQKVLIEELLVGTEVECAFLGSSNSPRVTSAGEIAPKEFYSYNEKYSENSEATLYVPARLNEVRMNELKELAIDVAKTLNIYGFARIDFWNLKDGRFVFNEVNTIPGITSISMFPKLWEYEGVHGQTWIEELICSAYKRKEIISRLQFGIEAT